MFKRLLILFLLLSLSLRAAAKAKVEDDDDILKPDTEEAAESQYRGYWITTDKTLYNDVT
jgi:hypothetical protein